MEAPNPPSQIKPKEIFLALMPYNESCDLWRKTEKGHFQVRWLNDPSVAVQYLNDGWEVYRCNFLDRIDDMKICFKTEKVNEYKCCAPTK